MQIEIDDLTRPDIIELLRGHLESAARHSPPESVHALDPAGLSDPAITFWTARTGSDLLGCCAIKQLDPVHGEIKSMRTAQAHLRKGVATALMQHLLAEAGRRGYQRLSLETGSMEAFAPARRLYARFGFTECPAFADYTTDPYSVFMTRQISTS
jgi:putative acetyltransferase